MAFPDLDAFERDLLTAVHRVRPCRLLVREDIWLAFLRRAKELGHLPMRRGYYLLPLPTATFAGVPIVARSLERIL